MPSVETNVITVKILNKIGVNYAIRYARNLGIESDLTPDLSLALGSSGVSLMELTRIRRLCQWRNAGEALFHKADTGPRWARYRRESTGDGTSYFKGNGVCYDGFVEGRCE